MATITGTVRCLRVNETFGFTRIEEDTGETETLILWFGTTIPSDLTSFTRIAQSMWVSLLREAHTNGLTVTATTTNGAIVGDIQLGTL